jgi:hypothetical protein
MSELTMSELTMSQLTMMEQHNERAYYEPAHCYSCSAGRGVGGRWTWAVG